MGSSCSLVVTWSSSAGRGTENEAGSWARRESISKEGSIYPEVAKLAGSNALAYFSFETYQYALFSFAEPCKEAGAALIAKTGYDLKLLGLTIGESEQELWKKVWQSPEGGCLGE
jgi:hypothetical protein